MAQVKVYGRAEQLRARRAAWSELIAAALTEAFALPATKRFQRFLPLDADDFLAPGDRSEHYTIIEIVLFEGRPVEAKKALYRELYARAAAAFALEPIDLEITLIETPRHDWGIRGVPGDELDLDYRVDAGLPAAPPVELALLDDGLPFPSREHAQDIGLDLRARETVTLSPGGGAVRVPTGITVAIPEGYVGLVCPRSGLAARSGVSVLNGPGIIDPGYTGEVQVVLFSVHPEPVTLERGDRIAQLVVTPALTIGEAARDGATRGDGGFGSTGSA
ncbi:MAG: dUTP diphosphatase [Patulibacter minatonensis]